MVPLPNAGDARDRLLPASVPFRFFAAALLFHLCGWLLLAAGPDRVAGFRGGPGWVLAALHLFTLGVLLTTAMGAAFQLLPMATVRPVRSVGWAKLCFWLTVPGVAILTHGMARFDPPALALGGALVGGGVLLFGALLADNLRSAGDMPGMRLCAGVALAALAAMAALGLALVVDVFVPILPDRASAAGAHLGMALFGFFGLMAAGFSTILVPMLTLGPAPSAASGRAVALVGAAGLALLALGGLTGTTAFTAAAAVVGLAASAIHLRAMSGVLRRRMRRRLGTAFRLIRGAWVMLPLSLLLALALALGVDGFNLPAVFVTVAVFGWLLSLLFGVLQRIAPFLASVHATRPGCPTPLVSRLAPERPLAVHAALHAAAVALLVAGNLADSEGIVRAGALCGAAGAVSLLVFAFRLFVRTRTALRASAPLPIPSH